MQEGKTGLVHAIDLFDWRRDTKFSSYATGWIRQRIGLAINKGSLVKVPTDRYSAANVQVRNVNGDETKMTHDTLCIYRASTPASLDKKVGFDGNASHGDLIASTGTGPEEAFMRVAHKEKLIHFLSILTERQRHIVLHKFGLSGETHSSREIAEELGISQQAVSASLKSALKKLRDNRVLLDR